MAEMALRQDQTEQMLQQTAGALQQSQQQAAAAATAAGQSASSQRMNMVDTRLLGKPERWNGEDKSWKDSRFITRAASSRKMKPETVDRCFTCWFSWSLGVHLAKEKVQLLVELSMNCGNLAHGSGLLECCSLS